MVEGMTQSTFARHEGEKFLIDLETSGLMEVELIEVQGLSPKSKATQRNPFSILFRGPKDPILVQRMYTVRHSSLGEMVLFLVPVGTDEDGLLYEAVFS